MSEIMSWDAVFFVKTLNQDVGIRVYYSVDRKGCAIRYGGHTREFGVAAMEYGDNPRKGDTTTYTYEFKVVTGRPYAVEEGGRRLACMDIRVDAVQNTETRGPSMRLAGSEFLDGGRPRSTTVRVECGGK